MNILQHMSAPGLFFTTLLFLLESCIELTNACMAHFVCDWDCLMVRFTVCGARYKTRPGLTYHLSHFHSGGDDEEDGGAAVITPSPKHQGDVPVGAATKTAGDIVDGRHLFLPLHCYSIIDFLS